MTKEQAYAALGRIAVKYARELSGYDCYPRDDMDDCTIRILGMADMLDAADQAGAFHDETKERKQEHYDRDHIWWRDAEEVMPEAGSSVLICNWNLLTDQRSIERGCWNGNLWIPEPYCGEGIKNVLYWAPLNPPEEDAWE